MPDTGRLTLVLGGARSGKSTYAENLVARQPGPWSYIATAQAFDEEMHMRIGAHRARRSEQWRTAEAPVDLEQALDAVPAGQALLLDCLTLWLSNVMLAGRQVETECDRLAAKLGAPRGPWVVVSNEVGFGIVPDNALARRFRDAAGRLNQQIAAAADEVVLMVAGLPMKVK